MEIVFLHNEEEYLNYKKIKPVRMMLNSKVRFICSVCNEEKIKTFKSLNFPFICKVCTNRIAQNNIDVKNKKKNTCIERYGVENCFQSKEKIEIAKQTKIQKYGDANYNNRNQAKKTCLERYGCNSPGQSPAVREKMRKTCIERFGVDSYFKTKECRIKNFNAFISDGISTLRSKKEQNLYEYIKDNYKDEIILNDRTVLDGKELDIYLPKLKLAFEFDGVYWHADPRFYNENFVIALKRNITAKEIWENDRKKDELCYSLGIRIVHIKEYDWDNDNLRIKELILKELNKSNDEEKNG